MHAVEPAPDVLGGAPTCLERGDPVLDALVVDPRDLGGVGRRGESGSHAFFPNVCSMRLSAAARSMRSRSTGAIRSASLSTRGPLVAVRQRAGSRPAVA